MTVPHTPGPWWAEDGAIYGKQEGAIVRVADTYNEEDRIHHEVVEANAHLLAAGPELLVAARRALFLLGVQAVPELRAAIEKAEGRGTAP